MCNFQCFIEQSNKNCKINNACDASLYFKYHSMTSIYYKNAKTSGPYENKPPASIFA